MRTVFILLGALLCGAAHADDAPKKLSQADLSVQTHKWDGKMIQASVHCFYADIDEYRCGAFSATGLGGLVRMDFKSIEPDTMKKYVEDKCDSLDHFADNSCLFTVVFRYGMHMMVPSEGGGEPTNTVIVDDGKGTFSRSGK